MLHHSSLQHGKQWTLHIFIDDRSQQQLCRPDPRTFEHLPIEDLSMPRLVNAGLYLGGGLILPRLRSLDISCSRGQSVDLLSALSLFPRLTHLTYRCCDGLPEEYSTKPSLHPLALLQCPQLQPVHIERTKTST